MHYERGIFCPSPPLSHILVWVISLVQADYIESCAIAVKQILVQSALKEANAVIEREQVPHLSRSDSETLLHLLEKPPEPTAEFKVAMAHYRILKKNDADSSFDWQP